MGSVVSFRAGTPTRAKKRPSRLSAPDAALMGVMADLLRAVVRDRRISVSEVTHYESPQGDPVAVATIRVFGLAPLTVVTPIGHDDVEEETVLEAAYQVAERLAEACDPHRAAARPFPLDLPIAEFEADARNIASKMTVLAAEPRLNADALKGLMGKLVEADIAHQLAVALWGAMAAFGQTALWARGEISAL